MKKAFLFLSVLVLSCATEPDLVEKITNSNNPNIKRVLDKIDAHEVQLIFTEVHKDSGKVSFNDTHWREGDERYFYPASSVKFPIAVMAMEKMHAEGNFNRDTKFYIEGDSVETTFAKEITKIFAVSDNAAYNRLFEFLGQDYINNRLAELGLKGRISHRLSVPDSDNVTTKSLVFYVNDSTTTTTEPIINNSLQRLALKDIIKGKGEIIEDSLVMTPKDFSLKNYLPVSALHGLMKRVIFPYAFPEEHQFKLSDSDYKFLRRTMQLLPNEAGYTSEDYYDSYGKFFIYGDSKAPIPEHMEISNKVGYAYGTLTDCAYIKNTKTGKEFIITATVHVNENGIFNDGVYEYEGLGIPFLAEVGRVLTGTSR